MNFALHKLNLVIRMLPCAEYLVSPQELIVEDTGIDEVTMKRIRENRN